MTNQIKHCMTRSRDSFDEAVVLAKSMLWNGVANRLYYSCFYAIHALCIKSDIACSGHENIKREVDEMMINSSLLSDKSVKTFNELYSLRIEDETPGFKKFAESEVKGYITQVQKLINEAEWNLY